LKWSMLNLEVGDVTNTKIYTSSGCRIIPYIQCGNMFPLLILEGSSKELVMGENTSLGVLQKCVHLVPIDFACLGAPFIGN
jgi:hypothetical protein